MYFLFFRYRIRIAILLVHILLRILSSLAKNVQSKINI